MLREFDMPNLKERATLALLFTSRLLDPSKKAPLGS